MSDAYLAEKEKLEAAILEQLKEVFTAVNTLNQNLQRLNDVGDEIVVISKSWNNYCDAIKDLSIED